MNKIVHLILAVVCGWFVSNGMAYEVFEETNSPLDKAQNLFSSHKLEIIDDELYVATTDGIYKYSEQSNSWEIWILKGVNVFDFKANEGKVVAIIDSGELSEANPLKGAKLVRHDLATGKTEDVMDSGMGVVREDGVYSRLYRIAQNPMQPASLITSAYPGIWKSDDFGTTWTLLCDILVGYDRTFLGWHPQMPNILFITGDDNVFNPIIYRSEDHGQVWECAKIDKSYEGACYDLAFDPQDSAHILSSFVKSIAESHDYGKTWQQVFNCEEGIESILYDAENPTDVYAIATGNDFLIYKSEDSGSTWRPIINLREATYDFDCQDAILFHDRLYLNTTRGVYAYDLNSESGISGLEEEITAGTPIYDLQGRRLNSVPQGSIYIQGGKKKITL